VCEVEKREAVEGRGGEDEACAKAVWATNRVTSTPSVEVAVVGIAKICKIFQITI
jgi:hypothetical protein